MTPDYLRQTDSLRGLSLNLLQKEKHWRFWRERTLALYVADPNSICTTYGPQDTCRSYLCTLPGVAPKLQTRD